MRQQQMMQQQQQQSLMPQQTGYGSNNPFAPSAGGQSLLGSINNGSQQQQQPSPQPSSSFLPVPSVSMDRPISPPQPAPAPAKPAFVPSPTKNDGQHSQLAGLLARGREDGLDTFGNMGNLRELPALRVDVRGEGSVLTVSGIPVGSGFHQSNAVHVQKTGFGANNPFGQPQQQQQQQQQKNDQPFFSL